MSIRFHGTRGRPGARTHRAVPHAQRGGVRYRSADATVPRGAATRSDRLYADPTATTGKLEQQYCINTIGIVHMYRDVESRNSPLVIAAHRSIAMSPDRRA